MCRRGDEACLENVSESSVGGGLSVPEVATDYEVYAAYGRK